MGSPVTIVGFSSANRVPGYYGETKYGAGPVSAASIPLILLLAGMKLTSGSAVANQDIVTILSKDDADAYFGPGAELARMCYAALLVPGVTIKAGAIPEAGGAAAATITITIGGTWTAVGTITLRINGEIMQYTVGAADSVNTTAAGIAALLNQDPRRPYTAAALSGVVTVTVNSKGVRGNQYIAFQDITKAPVGLTCVTAGGTPVTGGGIPFSGGSGADNCTTFLTLLTATQYDRICCSENDSTNLGRWNTQLNTNAGPTSNLTEHFITAVNGTNSAATSLAVALNMERMQLLQMLNGETAPWEMAAFMAATRCATEQTDPCAAYDDLVLTNTAPQSQVADVPSNATLQSLINNGVTPVYTRNGQALVSRSITTHSLSGSTPDYRTIDTSDAYVPDFVRVDIGLMWATDYKPSNPRVEDNPAADEKELPSGIAYPDSWNAAVTHKLRNYESGILSSTSAPTAQTVPPIITDVDDNLPTSNFDPISRRIMSAIPVVPAANQHQIGVSVRNVNPS